VQSPVKTKQKNGDEYQEYVRNVDTVRSAAQDLVGRKRYKQAKQEVARLEGSDIDSSEDDDNDHQPMAPMDWLFKVRDVSAMRNRCLALAILSIDTLPARHLNEAFELIQEIRLLGLPSLLEVPPAIKTLNTKSGHHSISARKTEAIDPSTQKTS
jgi:hypothetical protein